MPKYYGSGMPTITQGIVSKVFNDKIGIFFTTSPVNPGNSGGPIFDLNGNLVGVTFATMDKVKILKAKEYIPASMGMGIKSNMIKKVFKHKETIPVKNIKYNKSKIYKSMIGKIVLIGVKEDPKTKVKK